MKTQTAFLALVVALGLVATGTRFFRLGAWPYFADEIATFEEADSLFSGASGPFTSQIDKHHMFGTLLFVGEKFPFQGLIFRLGLTAATGSCQGTNRRSPLFDADHDFGRTTDQIDDGRP